MRLAPNDPLAVAAVQAIHGGDLTTLQRLLTENIELATVRILDPNPACGGSRTLLHIVTDWPGNFPRGAETVTALIQAGSEVNARFDGRHGETQSAAVLVADPRPGMSRRPDGITVNINVCEHPEPVGELRRIYDTAGEVLGFRTLEQPIGRDILQLKMMLHALGFFVGLTWIAAVIVDYVKRDTARGTWLESHFRWQIRTFWFGLLWGVAGAILAVVFVGFFILAANYIWLIYRVVKGWLYFNDRKPMYP